MSKSTKFATLLLLLAGLAVQAQEPATQEDKKEDKKREMVFRPEIDGSALKELEARLAKYAADVKSGKVEAPQGGRGKKGKKGAMNLREIIKKFDQDGDGMLDKKEAEAVREHFMERLRDDPELRGKIIKRFDRDGDGQLSDTERDLADEAFKKQQRRMAAWRQRIVKRFDGDGKLNATERARAKKFVTAMRARHKKRLAQYDADAEGILRPGEQAQARRKARKQSRASKEE